MNTRTALVTGLRAAAPLAPLLLLIGCAVVKINPGSTDTVEHSGGVEVGKDLANRVCAHARARQAEILSTVEKPADKGRYVTTFRCLY